MGAREGVGVNKRPVLSCEQRPYSRRAGARGARRAWDLLHAPRARALALRTSHTRTLLRTTSSPLRITLLDSPPLPSTPALPQPPRLHLACRDSYPTYRDYVTSLARRGGVLEGCPHMAVGSPCVNLFIDPCGHVSVLSTHEKIFCYPYRAVGTTFPQVCVLRPQAVTTTVSARSCLRPSPVIGTRTTTPVVYFAALLCTNPCNPHTAQPLALRVHTRARCLCLCVAAPEAIPNTRGHP